MALDTYGRLEALGHQSFVGRLSEETVAGAGFIRIDIVSGEKTITKYFAPGSIYCITPMAEEEVKEIERYAAARLLAPPRPTITFDEPEDGYGQADDDYEDDDEEIGL